MNNIKNTFSIKDLENLSGIKAHTIRIWEKRYGILSPDRKENNIRNYSISDLQNLLNIVFLNNYGYKISKISKLSQEQISDSIQSIYALNNNIPIAIKDLKIAMLNFDVFLFHKIYKELENSLSFSEIFTSIFIPFFEILGLLWQTDTIKPIHEHFVSQLILQKIITNTSLISNLSTKRDVTNTYVLFLPQNESHEIGLLFLNYELVRKGYKTIYLGANIPTLDLIELNTIIQNPVFITSFTTSVPKNDFFNFCSIFQNNILSHNNASLYIVGHQTYGFDYSGEFIHFKKSIQQLLNDF
jgi:DNA-binding transcriptional MerR regulator